MTLICALRAQADTCARMGSPFTGRVLTCLADTWSPDTRLAHDLAAYQGDIGPSGHSLPLRLAAGLHALVRQNLDAHLVAAYPPHDVDDATLQKAIVNALKTHEDHLCEWTRLPPQTNEVRRSAALIAMAHVACTYFDRPLVLSELGASAGLNLMWDRFALNISGDMWGPRDAALTLTPTWDGPPPPKSFPQVVDRSGVDLNPLNAQAPGDLLRLTSYLWADQPERLKLTLAAASVACAQVEKGDAINWLSDRLQNTPTGYMHIVQHTVAWQYFPAEAQKRGQALIEAAGAAATTDTPLAWMQMEADTDTAALGGAALTLRLWPGDITLRLGRADFHGRWIRWAAPGQQTAAM
ncbi:MAG: DUF2332 family protein [Pseudomonadota bacterium]